MAQRINLDLLLREIDLNVSTPEILRRNAEVIRENFRRIRQYLEDIGAEQIRNLTQIINQNISLDITSFDRSEAFDVSFDGQLSFTLSDTPESPDTSSALFLNTARLFYGSGYTISGNVVTFDPVAAGYQLEAVNEFGRPDRVVVYYNV